MFVLPIRIQELNYSNLEVFRHSGESKFLLTSESEMPLMFGEKIGKQEINIPAINCPSLPTQTYLGLPHLNCH